MLFECDLKIQDFDGGLFATALQGLAVLLWELGHFLRMDHLDLVGMGLLGMNTAGTGVLCGKKLILENYLCSI